MKRGLTYLTWLKQTRLAIALLVLAILLPFALLAITLIAPSIKDDWISPEFSFFAALATSTTLVAASVAWYAFSQWRQERSNVQRLQDLQGQYGLAEDLALLGSWVYHVAENRYDWSDGSFTVFGIDMDNGVPSSKGFLICIHPEDQERWKAAHKKAIRKGQDVRIEYRYIKHGKEVVWVRSVARCEKDPQGRVVRLAGIVQDTSAIRAMAAQLSRSEAKFRDLSQISSDWFWETDTEHKLSFLSESAISELGSWIRASVGHARWELSDPNLPGINIKRHCKPINLLMSLSTPALILRET
jgi:PAS domain-containing protein